MTRCALTQSMPSPSPRALATHDPACGSQHLKVWSVAQDHTGKETYSPVQATFGGASVQDILSVCFLPFGRIAAGIASGDILLFDISGRVGPSSCVKREKAHTPGRRVRNIFDGQLVHAGVRALCLRNGNSELVSGGADGQLLYWNIVGGKLEGPSKVTDGPLTNQTLVFRLSC